MDDICVMLMANWDQAGSVFAMDLIWGFLPEEGASERQMKSQLGLRRLAANAYGAAGGFCRGDTG